MFENMSNKYHYMTAASYNPEVHVLQTMGTMADFQEQFLGRIYIIVLQQWSFVLVLLLTLAGLSADVYHTAMVP